MDPFIGEIRLFAGNFAPRGWALCDGSRLPISQYRELYSILGTVYGGDGKTTFALPDFRGRAPVHAGAGPGLTPYVPGQTGGTSNVALMVNEMPSHTHQPIAASTVNATSPAEGVWGSTQSVRGSIAAYAAGGGSSTPMSPSAIKPAGSSAPHNNMQPYLGLNFIIALDGIFPPRS